MIYLPKQIALAKKNITYFLNNLYDEAYRLTPQILVAELGRCLIQNWPDQFNEMIFITGESSEDPVLLYVLHWNAQKHLVQIAHQPQHSFPEVSSFESAHLLYEKDGLIYGHLPFSKKSFAAPSSLPGLMILGFSSDFDFSEEHKTLLEQIRRGVEYVLNIRRCDFDEKIYRPFPEQ